MTTTEWDRKHFHHIDGKDEACINLTHCPAICDHDYREGNECDAKFDHENGWI